MEQDEKYEQLYERGFKEAYDKSYTSEDAKFKKLVKEKLVISLLGNVNAGKSKTINALTGKKLTDVRAWAGWTKEISIYEFSENVFIADTPGLNDIDEDVSSRTENFVDKDADIILFFLNAAVGMTKNEEEAFRNTKKLNRPIVCVLNKIDIWYENGILKDTRDYEDVKKQIEDRTGQEVLAISAKKEINIAKLNDKILGILEERGKDLLYMKITRYKEEKIKKWINGAAVSALGIGALPIPGADIVPLTALQVGLALKIAYIYNCKVTKNEVMQLFASTVTGSVGKKLYRLAIQGLKTFGWAGGIILEGAVLAAAALVAASITYAFGWACNAYYKSGMKMDIGLVGEVYEKMYKEYMKRKKEGKK